MLLFDTARSIYESRGCPSTCKDRNSAEIQPTVPQLSPLQEVKGNPSKHIESDGQDTLNSDSWERFDIPQLFQTSPSFSDELEIAHQRFPARHSEEVTSLLPLKKGATVWVTGKQGNYLQVKRDETQTMQLDSTWIPEVLDGLVLFVEKMNSVKPPEKAQTEEAVEEAIVEQQDQIQRFQTWWAEGKGKLLAAAHPVLSVVGVTLLAEVIATGANYHTCLSADRLDALQRKVGQSTTPSLEALRRALQTKGGAKSQARAVGSLIFKEAMDIFKNPDQFSAAASGEEVSVDHPEEPSQSVVVADEVFDPPKLFVCSEFFPPEATVAVRMGPNKASSLVTSLPYGSEILATASKGTYLQFKLENGTDKDDGRHVWVPRVLDGLVLFVEKMSSVKSPEKAQAEEAIVEQQDQIQRFQTWWAEGKGKLLAAAHPVLSVVGVTLLAEVIATGANYHTCLSADRLDALQRKVGQSTTPSLEALRRALQTKGGAKSQARAVGSLIFKEAMDIFKNPDQFSAAASGEEVSVDHPFQQAEELSQSVVVADEVFDPPKLFVCSEFFPPEATVAVRMGPNKASSLVTSLPYGSEILATASKGTYLQFKLENGTDKDDGRHVWVPRVLDGLVLFVEKMSSVKSPEKAQAEEAIVEQQDQIQRFQAWWAEGKGKLLAAAHPVLSVVGVTLLAEVIATGANYHTCLSADRLDALQRKVGQSTTPSLEALRRALQTKGGAKSQARAVGSLIFKEAMDIFKNPDQFSAAASGEEVSVDHPFQQAEEPSQSVVVADEVFDPPKLFVCSEFFPPEATVAVRMGPNKASSLVTSLPYGSEILATASKGTYLQFKLENGTDKDDGRPVWVPRVLDGLVLFVEKMSFVKSPEKAQAEEAIVEQQDQIQRFQAWWAEGKGKLLAAAHPVLSVVGVTLLAEVIATGANYHTCLSADRLDALQRKVGQSTTPSLEALRRALQTKGGAKSQARAVGSLIFKEAMDIFKNPDQFSAAASGEEVSVDHPFQQAEEPSQSVVVADEVFDPPKLFVCSEFFPPEATVAVRVEASQNSQFLTCLPHGTEPCLHMLLM